MPAWEYNDRWALVTGASAGIGETFARELARRGMHLVLAARREDRLRALADQLSTEHGVQTAAVPIDLGKPGAAGVLWLEASHEGRAIHLVVNNAGFGLKGPFADLSLDRQAEMVRVNCSAPLELAHFALQAMGARGEGGILNVASIAAYQPIPTMATYAATKAFLLTLSEAISHEARGTGVRVTCVNPGPVQTEFQQVAGTAVSGRTPGVRTPEQVVTAALGALERGDPVVVPGIANRLAMSLARFAPRSLVLDVARRVMNER